MGSQACIDPEAKKGTNAKVMINQNEKRYAIASLKEGEQEFCALDLFVESGNTTLSVKGNASVHLTGYFEPDDMDVDEEEVVDTKKDSPKVEAKKVQEKKAVEEEEVEEEEEEEEEE